MPATFDRPGLSFQYPENWSLDEADIAAGRESVTVYTPGAGFWSVSRHPIATEPGQLAESAVDAMREEYGDVETYPIAEPLAGREAVGFDVNFHCLDLTNTARVRCLRTGGATYAFFWQAEDREFASLEAVFAAIAHSLLQQL